jgi:hypothetical protein
VTVMAIHVKLFSGNHTTFIMKRMGKGGGQMCVGCVGIRGEGDGRGWVGRERGGKGMTPRRELQWKEGKGRMRAQKRGGEEGTCIIFGMSSLWSMDCLDHVISLR